MTRDSLRNFSYVAINRVLTTALYGLFWIVIAFILTPDRYGELTYLVSLAGIISLISKFGSHYSIVIIEGEGHSNFVRKINFLVLIISIPSSLTLLVTNPFAALACMGFSFFAMNQNNLLAVKKYKNFMWNGLTKSILLLTIPITLYYVMGISGILLGTAISDLISSWYYFKSLKFDKPFRTDFRENHKMLLHNFAIDLSMNLPRVADKIIIAPLFGFLLVGIYQFNFQILSALETLPIALHTYLLPEESSGQSHKNIIYPMIGVSILLVIIIIFLGPIVVNQFFPKYSEGIVSLQILIITLIPLTLASVFSAKLQARKSTIVGYSLAVRLISLLGLIVILGKWYGLTGLSMAVLISTVMYTVFLFTVYKLTNSSNK